VIESNGKLRWYLNLSQEKWEMGCPTVKSRDFTGERSQFEKDDAFIPKLRQS